jgi:hypothetical protein
MSAQSPGSVDLPAEASTDRVTERFGWVVAAVVVALAASGVLGGHLWTTGRVGTATGFAVEFPRVSHRVADEQLVVEIPAPPPGQRVATLTLGEEWLRTVELRGVVPEPAAMVAVTDGIRVVVVARSAAPVRLRIAYRSQSPRVVEGAVTAGAETLRFRQVVLP